MAKKCTYNHDWGDKLIYPEWAKLVRQSLGEALSCTNSCFLKKCIDLLENVEYISKGDTAI